MIERCEQPRLSLEPLLPLFTFQEIFRQYLDRDVPRESRVPGPVHLPHPPRAEGREDLVGTEPDSRADRHLCDRILSAKESQVRGSRTCEMIRRDFRQEDVMPL